MYRKYWQGAPVYVFEVPQDYEFEPQQCLYLMNTLLALEQFAMQIVARPTGIRWQVIDLNQHQMRLNTLKFHQVSVKLSQHNPLNKCPLPFYRGKLAFTTEEIANRPLLYISQVRAAGDPLLQIAQTLSYLKDGEEVRYTVLVKRAYKPSLHQGLGVVNSFLNLGRNEYQVDPYIQTIEHKMYQPWYETMVMLDVDSPAFKRVHHLRQAVGYLISGSFDRNNAGEPFNGLRSRNYPKIFKIGTNKEARLTTELGWYARHFEDEEIEQWWNKRWLYFESTELASLWHLPHTSFVGTAVRWAKSAPRAPREMIIPREIVLGEAMYQDERVPVYLNLSDRTSHTSIAGHTGTGKSTLMHNQIDQDIKADRGVAVIDPHGSLVSNILQTSIPPHREDDVIVLDVGNEDFPVPLNVFSGSQSYAALGRIVDIIDQMYQYTGVQIDKYLRNGIRALQHVPQATMKDLYRLLTDGLFRSEVLAKIVDDVVFHTWNEGFHLQSPGNQDKFANPVLNRIRPFYDNPYLYPILCHPYRADLERWVDEQKIILISLRVNSEKVPRPERNLIGSLFVSMFQMIGMHPERESVPFYVYIDEVQHFVKSSLHTVFSEGRKFDLYLTVANQFLDQLDEQTLKAILGNVGTIITFRSSVDDAYKIAPLMQPEFDATRLMKLDKYQAAVKTQLNGHTQDAFLLYSPNPISSSQEGMRREQFLRQKSIQNYTPISRSEVLAWLDERYPKRNSVSSAKRSDPDVIDGIIVANNDDSISNNHLGKRRNGENDQDYVG